MYTYLNVNIKAVTYLRLQFNVDPVPLLSKIKKIEPQI